MKTLLSAFLGFLFCCSAMGQTSREMLQSFVDGWRGNEEMRIDRSLSIAVKLTDDKNYLVQLDSSGTAALHEGISSAYYFHYVMTLETLKKIYKSELNALTAMGAAKEGDITPLDVGFAEGTAPDENFLPFFLSFSFHFWNKDWPEKIFFSEANSRFVHGGLATVFYYQPGLRTAWYKLKPGMHANEKADDQKNPFPSMFIVTKGKGLAKLGGKRLTLTEGQMYFIPSDMTHEFWCDNTEMECIMIAFGDGA